MSKKKIFLYSNPIFLEISRKQNENEKKKAGKKQKRLTWMQLAFHTYEYETLYFKILNEIYSSIPTDLTKIIVHYLIYAIYKQNQGQVIFQCLCEFNIIRNYLLINHAQDKLMILHDSLYALDIPIVSKNISLTTCIPLPEIMKSGPLIFIDRFNIYQPESPNKLILYKNVDIEIPTWKKEVFIVPIHQCFLDHKFLYIVDQDIYYFDPNHHVQNELPLLAWFEGYQGEQCMFGVNDKEDFFFIFTGYRDRTILVCSKSNVFVNERSWIPYGSRTLFQDLKRIEIFDHYLYFLFLSQIHIYSTTASQDSDLLQILSLRGESIESLVFMKTEMYVMTNSYSPRIFIFK